MTGAHVLLFFLAFVFGSFCTFCFHMLMYLFDEKCVLFPKLLALPSLKHNVIYEFIPSTKDLGMLPVDFLSPQWVEKSTCSLPTFVPLVSGIFGLIWTTIFLMCSTGRRLTGLQRPWRVVPPIFVFSLVMSCICIYSSIVTHYGLYELCAKLGEITGSPTCSYTINVATLSYERRIRGVYQATRLTILSAWLHTACWLLSAVLALIRVLLAVDFKLVRVTAQLHGDIDKILERHEMQIRTISPDTYINEENERASFSRAQKTKEEGNDSSNLTRSSSDLIYMERQEDHMSEHSLVPEERRKLSKVKRYELVDRDTAFIVTLLYDLLKHLPLAGLSDIDQVSSISPFSEGTDVSMEIVRQYGQELLKSRVDNRDSAVESKPTETLFHDPEVRKALDRIDSLILSKYEQVRKSKEGISFRNESPQASTSKRATENDSIMNITPEMQHVLDTADVEKRGRRKSNLKNIGIQTEKDKKLKAEQHVQITVDESNRETSEAADDDQSTSASDKKDAKDVDDKDTQTREKEKQD